MRLLFCIFQIFIIFIACNRSNQDLESYTDDIYRPSYSKSFSITGKDNSENSLIKVINPWQGAENIETSLLIIRDEEKPVNFEGQVIKGKADRIICMSSTHIAMLDAIDDIDKIVGVSGMQYITNKEIRRNENKIPDVGYEGNIDYEAILAAKPDLILLYSVNGFSSMEPKLKELGIPFIYIGDYLEENPLGKAEWIVAIAEIMGKREDGIKKFEEISKKYDNLRQLVVYNNLEKPKVMVNLPFGDAWFMPSTQSYVAKLIEDAGGEYIYKKNTGTSSLPIDLEEAFQLTSKTDYWLNLNNLNSIDELKSEVPKFSETRVVKEGKVYNNNYRCSSGGGNDCFETGVINPDLILRDLIKIFHPELINEDFVYYHKLK